MSKEDNNRYQKSNLDKLIHSSLRAIVMTILAKEGEANFVNLKKRIGTTDGNLSISMKKLVEANYILEDRSNAGRNQTTTYRLTSLGRQKYKEYLEQIQLLYFSD